VLDDATRRAVGIVVVFAAVFVSFLEAGPADLCVDNFVAEALESGKVLVPLVAHVGMAELHVVKEFFLEVLEHHAAVLHLDEVHHPVRPGVLVRTERQEHV